MADEKIMTVARLAKILNELVAAGYGKRRVAVDNDTLDTGNDTFGVCVIHGAEITRVRIVDGNGFTEENKDGSERTRTCLVFRGRRHDKI